MMSIPPMPRPSGHSLLIGGVLLTVAVLTVWWLVLATSAQDQLEQVTDNQVTGISTGTSQRTDQQQLTCAIWAALSDEALGRITAEVRRAADAICSDVPTPAASP